MTKQNKKEEKEDEEEMERKSGERKKFSFRYIQFGVWEEQSDRNVLLEGCWDEEINMGTISKAQESMQH